ncbi:MAG: tRNA1(Val) (adenine(37)-N6)-methyltransferase [Lachnospiraceae bacterium]|nr:tRNA1(Val) (adenine(37)-N6)-methyltransferase [Candidatus Merdinaster equi]
MQVEIKPNEKVDDLQRNGYRIIQDKDRFCFGMDAVLLSGFVKARPGDRVLDLGTGTGILPILLCGKTKAEHYTAIEIQPESVEMARRSVLLNDLQDRIDIVQGDICSIAETMRDKRASFDIVVSNPPYMADNHGIQNEADAKTIARHEILCTLEDVVTAASKMIKPSGHFYMVHRPFRLADIITSLKAHHFEPKRMRMVHASVAKEPSMVLIEAIHSAKPGMIVEKPWIIYEEDGSYTRELKEDYGF